MQIVTPRKKEYIAGGIYLLFFLFINRIALQYLPELLGWDVFDPNVGMFLNLLYFTVNFVAVLLIFGGFLRRSWENVRGSTLPLALRTFAIYFGISVLWGMVLLLLGMRNQNVNQQAVNTMVGYAPGFMILSTVIYAPVTEECLFRGLIYAPFAERRPWLGAILSATAFSLIHVTSSIGVLSALEVVLAFLQYLPAGFCLAYLYRRTRTIWGCIFLHMIINLYSVVMMFFVM